MFISSIFNEDQFFPKSHGCIDNGLAPSCEGQQQAGIPHLMHRHAQCRQALLRMRDGGGSNSINMRYKECSSVALKALEALVASYHISDTRLLQVCDISLQNLVMKPHHDT